MEIGAFLYVRNKEEWDNLENELQWFQKTGLTCCQLNIKPPEYLTAEAARTVKTLCDKYGVRIVGMATTMDGPKAWDLEIGPMVSGIVPTAYRAQRIESIKRVSDFVAEVGANTLFMHLGFVPVNRHDPEYIGTIIALRHVCEFIEKRGQRYLFETGQESPVVLMRVLEDLGANNVGINLDPGNITMYGLGNAIDMVEMLGDKVFGLHAKDGMRPTSAKKLGEETFLGEGHARFFDVLNKLITENNFAGDIIIEREVPNEQRHIDVEAELKLIRAAIEQIKQS